MYLSPVMCTLESLCVLSLRYITSIMTIDIDLNLQVIIGCSQKMFAGNGSMIVNYRLRAAWSRYSGCLYFVTLILLIAERCIILDWDILQVKHRDGYILLGYQGHEESRMRLIIQTKNL